MIPLLPLAAAPDVTPAHQKIAQSAEQFEAIFVRQMLAEARKSHFGGDALFGGQGMETFRQIQDERFADIAARSGAFGIGKMVAAQLGDKG